MNFTVSKKRVMYDCSATSPNYNAFIIKILFELITKRLLLISRSFNGLSICILEVNDKRIAVFAVSRTLASLIGGGANS